MTARYIDKVPADRIGDYRYLTGSYKMLGGEALDLILSGKPIPSRKKMDSGVANVPASEVIARVLEQMRLTEADLRAKTRKDWIVSARAVIAVVLREAGGSYPWIAARLGMKNHTSPLHLVETFPIRLARVPELEAVKLYAAAVSPRKVEPVAPFLAEDVSQEQDSVDDDWMQRRFRIPPPIAPEEDDGDTQHMKRVRQKMVAGSALLLDALKSARAV